MANVYYTLDTVKPQLLKDGKLVYPEKGFPSDWQYCPCITEKRCIALKNEICPNPVYIGISIKSPHYTGESIIEIFYVRKNHKGFIRANNMRLNQLIEDGVIDISKLKTATI